MCVCVCVCVFNVRHNVFSRAELVKAKFEDPDKQVFVDCFFVVFFLFQTECLFFYSADCFVGVVVFLFIYGCLFFWLLLLFFVVHLVFVVFI